MANTPTKLNQGWIYNQPTWHFWHKEQEYIIYLNIASDEDGKEARMIILAVPEAQEDYFVPKEVLRSMAWQINEYPSIKEGIEQHFLPKVNEYLAAQGEPDDGSFPIEGSDVEQYNWIVENALEYINGKVIMKAF